MSHPETFTVMKGTAFKSVPWAMVEPHRRQAMRNHYQTLERLNECGGLTYCELVAVLEDREWHRMDVDEAY